MHSQVDTCCLQCCCLVWLHIFEFFSTSDLQFGFKSGFSTTLCTGVLKAVINRYLNGGSKVYACLIDASKAFDLVDHSVLFKKLLQRNMPKPLVRFLLRWYKSQHLRIRWMGKSSDCFQVSNGVRQGGVLSPILFTIYVDSLLESLRASGRGCHWEDHFSGALCYADDLTILAPCPDALRKMLAHSEEFAESHGIHFNASKMQLICFRRTSQPDRSRFWFVVNSYHQLTRCYILAILYSMTSQTNLMFSVSRWHLFVKPILLCIALEQPTLRPR